VVASSVCSWIICWSKKVPAASGFLLISFYRLAVSYRLSLALMGLTSVLLRLRGELKLEFSRLFAADLWKKFALRSGPVAPSSMNFAMLSLYLLELHTNS
jgi:hypothetical protein